MAYDKDHKKNELCSFESTNNVRRVTLEKQWCFVLLVYHKEPKKVQVLPFAFNLLLHRVQKVPGRARAGFPSGAYHPFWRKKKEVKKGGSQY
jgi:hypothetical protein